MRRSIMGIVAYAGVLLAPFSMPAHAGPGTWTTQGPWGGSALNIAVHPQNPSRVYAIGQGGMFRSTDGGTSWQRAENGLPAGIRWVGRFWVAPSNGDVLYLYLRRIEPTGLDLFFRSTDGAQRWQRINYNLPPGALFRTLAIDALNSNRLAIVTNVAGAAAVSRSFDGGATFSPLPVGSGYPAPPRTTNGFAWHGLRMLAGISNDPVAMLPAQVFISTNDGAAWTAGGTLAGGTYVDVPALTTAPSSPITALQVYAIANNGTANVGQSSSDGGVSWVQRPGLISPPWVSSTAPNILLQIASVFSGETFETRVESSTNSAAAFTVRTTLSLPQFSAVSAPAGYNSGSNQVFYTASISSGLYRTNDNGSTMVPINQGFGSVSVHALASPAGSPLVIYAGQTDGIVRSHAMFRSINGGVSWAPMDLSTVRAAFISDIAIDRSAPTRIYAVGGSTINVTLTNSGIYRSLDGGTTWNILGSGLPVVGSGQRPIGAVNRFVLDPRSCPTPPPTGPCTGTGSGSFPLRTGYVVADGQNVGGGDALIVYKSTNLDVGTPSFSAANVGLTQPPNGSNNFLRGRALVIDPFNTQVLYLGTEIAFSTGTAPAGNYLNGVFKSTNGGASWVHASNGLPQWSPTNTTKLNVFALAIDPTNPNILYAAVARNGVERASDASIYKTTNGGASWFEVGQGLVGASIRSLVIDPNNPQIVYAGGTGTLTHPGGVFRTVNGGATWNSRSVGLPADAVYALLIDAANTNPQRVLAGTNAGVWEITQIPDGDRDAANTPIEDGAPNGGDGNGDGILDSIQSSVASVTGPILPLPDPPAIASPKGRSNYISMGGGVTLQGTSAHGKSSCTQLNDAQAFDPVIYPDDPMTNGELHRYPFGIISVSLPNCSSTTLQIRFHDASFDTVEWRWRNYGPTTPGNDGTLTWYNYSSNATLINPQTWAVTVTAGALGSWRSDPGSILFRGGPAYIGDRLFRDGFEDP